MTAGSRTVQESFDARAAIAAPSPFWSVVIGDPEPTNLFDPAVHDRGAMTLHALRRTVGDPVFFDILRRWAASRAGDNVTTDEFISLVERLAGQDLDALFTTWLFTPAKPAGIEPAAQRTGTERVRLSPMGLRRAFGAKR